MIFDLCCFCPLVVFLLLYLFDAFMDCVHAPAGYFPEPNRLQCCLTPQVVREICQHIYDSDTWCKVKSRRGRIVNQDVKSKGDISLNIANCTLSIRIPVYGRMWKKHMCLLPHLVPFFANPVPHHSDISITPALVGRHINPDPSPVK